MNSGCVCEGGWWCVGGVCKKLVILSRHSPSRHDRLWLEKGRCLGPTRVQAWLPLGFPETQACLHPKASLMCGPHGCSPKAGPSLHPVRLQLRSLVLHKGGGRGGGGREGLRHGGWVAVAHETGSCGGRRGCIWILVVGGWRVLGVGRAGRRVLNVGRGQGWDRGGWDHHTGLDDGLRVDVVGSQPVGSRERVKSQGR